MVFIYRRLKFKLLCYLFFVRVKFPKEVKWLCLEFDARSCTAQTEDSLQLYIPNYRDFTNDDNKHVVTTPYIPVLKKFSNDPMEWPFAAVMLPGKYIRVFII